MDNVDICNQTMILFDKMSDDSDQVGLNVKRMQGLFEDVFLKGLKFFDQLSQLDQTMFQLAIFDAVVRLAIVQQASQISLDIFQIGVKNC
jgi:hypothetical protein